MVKVAIYDIIHIEQVLPLIRVVNYLDIQALFFTNETFRDDILKYTESESGKVKFYYKAPREKEISFINNAKQIIKKERCGIFILNSIDSKHLIWSRILNSIPDTIFINTLHEINNLFLKTGVFGLRPMLRQWGKKIFVEKTNAFIVNTQALKNNIDARALTKKKVWLIPQAIFYPDQVSFPSKEKRLTIVIPGSIDGRRRDYGFALNVYRYMMNQKMELPSLVIAGGPFGAYGKQILKEVKELNSEGGDITYFDNNVPEPDFNRIINESHLLWSPQMLDTSINDGIPEIYGETKNSGNIHVALRFARPMLIPSELKTALPEQKSALRYTDVNSCSAIIQRLMNNPGELNYLNTEALNESAGFSMQAAAEKFSSMLEYYKRAGII